MQFRNLFLVSVAVFLAAGGFFYLLLARTAPSLTVVTWAGPYGRAQASALFLPYSQRSGVKIRIVQYDGGLDELRSTAARDGWDVVDLELPDAVAACRARLLEPLPSASLPRGADGAPASTDFVPPALGPCWVGSMVYSQAIAYAPRAFAGNPPSSLADFFDTPRFPGKRALKRSSAKFNLEMALLADGVPPAEVYEVLGTPAGVNRALAKLDTIRSEIVWRSHAGEATAMLQDGRAAFATILNGEIYTAATHHQELGVIWDRQMYETDVFGIPKGAAKKSMALDFIRFATSAPSLAAVAEWVPYGPARRSALPLVGRNPELGIAMRPFLPTGRANFATAFAIDDGWWQAHGAEIAPLWDAWLARTP